MCTSGLVVGCDHHPPITHSTLTLTLPASLLTYYAQPLSPNLLLPSNEIYKQIKEEAKKKEWEFDQQIMKQYADMLDKQEKARLAQLEKLKEWQAKQEREAAARPEAKRWIDPAIVEK